eukprot:GFUD01045865.1.p1 GENE.GFUD01045865.1~~GFUD01045865.1.p1  ORF type:complete len:249 (-),score=85.56 GFUD01045865.1:60-737(-)
MDGLVWVITFFSTVFLDVNFGLVIGVMFNLGMILFRANIPTVVVMEKDEESKLWLDRAMYKVSRGAEAVVVTVRGPVNFLTLGLVKMIIEYEIKKNKDTTAFQSVPRDNSGRTIVKIDTGDVKDDHDDISTSEDEMIPDNKLNSSQDVILDLSCVTHIDTRGCSLLPWLEDKVKAGGGWLGLVVDGQVEDMVERSGLLDRMDCQVYPTLYDAVELSKLDKKHKSH